MIYRVLFALALLCVASCMRPPTPAPQPVRAIAVFPPNNRTGDPLLITGTSFVEKYLLETQRYTVADALRVEAGTQLVQRGFDVVDPQIVSTATNGQVPASAQDAAALAARNHIEGAVLYIEIRRWEPNVGTEPTFIIASVLLTLIEPATGRALWTADHPSRPVQTLGVINLGTAYSVAAHTLMTEMLAPLVPAAPMR